MGDKQDEHGLAGGPGDSTIVPGSFPAGFSKRSRLVVGYDTIAEGIGLGGCAGSNLTYGDVLTRTYHTEGRASDQVQPAEDIEARWDVLLTVHVYLR